MKPIESLYQRSTLVGYKEILVKPPYQSNFRAGLQSKPPEDLKSDPFPIHLSG
jgi:hypothetical protein